MRESNGLEEAIGLIYDTALDRAAWPRVLSRLAGLFDCTFADSFQRTFDYKHFSGVAHGLDERDYQDVFLGYWVKRNVWGSCRPVIRAGDIVTTREMTPVDELRRSDMYQEYLGPRGLHEGLRLDIWAGEGWIEDVSLLRPWSKGPYTAKERQTAQALMPHLQRSTAVARRLREADSMLDAGLSALEGVRTAMLLVSEQGRVVHCNRAGLQVLSAADGLASTPFGLQASTPGASAKLARAIGAAAGQAGDEARSGALRLPRPSGGPAYSVVTLPLRQAVEAPDVRQLKTAAVLVCVIDPAAGAMVKQSELMAMFAFTQAEASLAADLLDGLELREIAERRGRSINTLRTQLARLMAKTDTRRQAELVGLLARVQFG